MHQRVPVIKKFLGNLIGGALALAISEHANAYTDHTLLVVPDPQLALKLQGELEQFLSRRGCAIS